MDSNIKSNTSFWSEISDYKIQVPYYQRDYAQGRIDNGRIDNIRKVFVEELYGAIKGPRICHLGLVFGSYNENEKVFIAVDGQQRLTTVFLLHWYAAWRENKLNDYEEKLLHFSWDTRSYSSQFVELLFKIQPSNNVIDAIKTNSNYFSVWENDPTVKGMLTMLEEIEEQYPNNMVLCSQLFSNDCNIKYDILKLEKDSDGKTYLKMNSRGRSLTTFELFKSKFLDKYKPDFGHKFDNEWLSFMIKISATSDSQFSDPDIPFMNFINEYTYLQLKLKSGSNIANDYKEFTDAKVKGELTDVPFISFDKYNRAFDGDCLVSFEKSLDWICHNYDIIKQIDDEVRFSGSRFFIDAIIKENNPNFSHRAKLFAAFKYAELTNYSEVNPELYKKWTRVFRNLVANTDVDGSNIGGICKAINKIDNSNIYCYLSNGGELTAFTKNQVAEEIAKAKQILDEDGNLRKYKGSCKKEDGSEYNTWEEIIIDAEKFAFFKGAIAFLFNDANGQPTAWNLFNRKLERAKQIFDENGVRKDYLIDTLLCLYSYCDQWENQLWWSHKIFNGLATTWKENILTLVDRSSQYVYASSVHHILMGHNPTSEIEDNRIKTLANRSLIEYIIKQNDNKKDMYIRWPHDALYFCGDKRGVLLSHDYRNKVILNMMLKDNRFQLNNKDVVIPDTNLLWGFDIDMIYKEQEKTIHFRWYREKNNQTYDIYLMDDQWKYIPRPNEKGTEQGDRKNYYCFNVDRETPNVVETIIEKLKLELSEIDSNT